MVKMARVSDQDGIQIRFDGASRRLFIPGRILRFFSETVWSSPFSYNAYRADTAFFIDPPYTVAGRQLYRHSELDHKELFKVASTIKGNILMTYDNADGIRELAAEFGLKTKLVAMKNTHHEIMNELLVGKNLDWVSSA